MAEEVWGALVRIAPATVADLAIQTGRHATTVRKALRRLERHKLAAHGGNQWTWLERDPDELVAELGVRPLREQRRKRRHQRYADDREARQERQAEREREQRERERDRATAPQPASTSPPATVDLVAASEAAGQSQMAAADGKRGQWSSATALPKRLAVCQGPGRHERRFSDATLDHLRCTCGARYGWAA